MTSSGSAEHDRHLEKHVNCSVMVRYCSFQTGNEMRCDWCVALLDICFHIGVQQESMGCRKTCKVDKLLRQSQRDVVCGQRQRLPTAKKSNQIRGTDKVSRSCGKISANVNVHKGSVAAALSTAEPYMCGTPWLHFDIFACILLNTLIFDCGVGELYWGQKWDESCVIAVIKKA